MPISNDLFTYLAQWISEGMEKAHEEMRKADPKAFKNPLRGLGKGAFSDSDVLLLEVKPFVKEEYEAEQERIRQAEERERIKKEIADGTYRHKDIIY